jgi:predicted membrane protein
MARNVYRTTKTTSVAYDLWSILAFLVWWGVMFALCTIVIAVVLAAVLLTAVYGLLMPSKTIRGQLQALYAFACAAVAQVKTLDHR